LSVSESKIDRRGFLAGAAGLTGVALSVGAWKPVFAMEAASAGPLRDLVPAVQRVGHIAFTLDETPAGFVSSAVGGSAFADVVNEKVGPDHIARKHIAGVKYEDITVTCGTGMGKDYYSWIQQSIGGNSPRHSGSIAGTDFNFKIIEQRDFSSALITEVGFPALDAASKEGAKLSIKFQPETTRVRFGGGGSVSPGTSNVKLSKWDVNNFKLTINGMDTSFVSKIDVITVKLDYATFSGEAGTSSQQLSQIEFPNIKLTVAESHAQDFFKWHQDFVINGNNSIENKKIGSLSFLSTNLQKEFFRLDFSGLGIFALDPDPLTPSNAIRQVTPQLFCDRMVFNFKI
jgi:hypothetical protein